MKHEDGRCIACKLVLKEQRGKLMLQYYPSREGGDNRLSRGNSSSGLSLDELVTLKLAL